MIQSSAVLGQFEKEQLRAAAPFTPWAAASRRFDALWAEARRLNPDLGADW